MHVVSVELLLLVATRLAHGHGAALFPVGLRGRVAAHGWVQAVAHHLSVGAPSPAARSRARRIRRVGGAFPSSAHI